MKTVHGRKYPFPGKSEEFKAFKKTKAADIHGIYEQTMLEFRTTDALTGVNQVLQSGLPKVSVKSGHEAAVATVQLMFNSQKRLPPKTIINADDPSLGEKARAEALWNKTKIRTSTIASLADSVQLLADLWSSAWKVGKGNNFKVDELVEFSEEQMNRICRKEHKTFVPSLTLDEMAESGDFEP